MTCPSPAFLIREKTSRMSFRWLSKESEKIITSFKLSLTPVTPTRHSRAGHIGYCSRPCTPSFTIQPFVGNPKNYARYKAKFRALYENEYNGSSALLFTLEELLSKEVRNEIGNGLTDGS
ncbi:hypothetical protein OUZ56_012131 [Daphnia magna]|uniref:Uncharacterized protein n=1 Tax=Daphnia magna TaxID=35525 RepID=A0ABQ9Z246_9CRUS|nr:hypothetical protein OUZ56_012131 [Daphnia magna]